MLGVCWFCGVGEVNSGAGCSAMMRLFWQIFDAPRESRRQKPLVGLKEAYSAGSQSQISP